MHRFTNYKFEVFIYEDKFLWNCFEWLPSCDTFLKTNFEKFEPKKLIYHNFKQFDSDKLKLDICNSISAMKTHAAFENNFVSILEKYAPKKTKILGRDLGESKTRF